MLKDFSKEEFDIVIQAGQSNSDGTGFGTATEPYEPNDMVWYLNGDFTISMAAEQVRGNDIQSNYSMSFAREYIKSGMLQDNRKLLILRTSVGGTGFSDKRWGMNDDLYHRMMKMTEDALKLNPKNKLVAFLWHQGETDSCHLCTYEEHYKNLSGLLNSVRTTFHCGYLPFIAGDFVKQWKDANAAICEPVICAIKDVCKNSGNSLFVTTDDLLSNAQTYDCQDTIHFSREALYKLGVKYFNAFQDLKSKE